MPPNSLAPARVLTAEEIGQRLHRLLPRVEKPGRYFGGELNQVVKDWDATALHAALVFPDVYDLGMSNLGVAILYDILNRQPEMLAERVYAPWPDMEAALRQAGLPLYGLETKHALLDFDLIGISLPYETLYTNVLTILDLGGIPLRASQRGAADTIVIAGGHATFNPEPMAEFIDAFAIGEGEEVVLEIAHAVLEWRRSGRPRPDLLRALAGLRGVYVPSLYDVHYMPHGTVDRIESAVPEARIPVLKRIVPRLPPPLTRFVVPYVDVTHNRIPVEIQRGCTRGCRFCQAGMITRPVRERPVAEVVEAIEQGLAHTGYEEVGLLSLSSSDYGEILDLVRQVSARFAGRHLNINLPSLRIESFSVELMDLLQGESSRSGFTLAPEAATERMREIINKPVSTEQVLSTAREIYRRG
ncbi:MAG: TIGR03960 family B12-binding radical SAM protein, partial [Chloroflexi bacterium]|nr:TIGR03960 family B12-binding radical SAM protein [Chloroflexota bacterium]